MDLPLRNQAMINQFVNTTGCSWGFAQSTLETCKWNMEVALSAFYQQLAPPPGLHGPTPANTPANTPATPPQFPDAMAAFKNLRVDRKQSS